MRVETPAHVTAAVSPLPQFVGHGDHSPLRFKILLVITRKTGKSLTLMKSITMHLRASLKRTF